MTFVTFLYSTSCGVFPLSPTVFKIVIVLIPYAEFSFSNHQLNETCFVHKTSLDLRDDFVQRLPFCAGFPGSMR
jgi:hypothetical protein